MKNSLNRLKYSWDYHWGVFCEIWDMFILRKYYWLVVGLLVVLCVAPSIAFAVTPFTVVYYTHNPFPTFAPSLSQELAVTDYYRNVPEKPAFLLVLSYCWVTGSGFGLMAQTLCIVTGGLLLVAYLREGREEKAMGKGKVKAKQHRSKPKRKGKQKDIRSLEYEENRRLAGDRLMSCEYATHILTQKGVRIRLSPRSIYFRLRAIPMINRRVHFLIYPFRGFEKAVMAGARLFR